jgi:hypothetical protein
LQVAKDRGGALPVADLDELLRLAESLVGRGEGAEEEDRESGDEDDGEDDDRAEGGEVLAASAARFGASGYDALLARSSR